MRQIFVITAYGFAPVNSVSTCGKAARSMNLILISKVLSNLTSEAVRRL